MFKKLILSAAVSGAMAFTAAPASAQTIGAGLAVGSGHLSGEFKSSFGGAAIGNGSVTSSGSAIAATQINANGTSYQHTDGASGGGATIGGIVNAGGAQIRTDTYQYATVNSNGNTTGNAPGEIGGVLYNGTGGLGKSDVFATGQTAFNTTQTGNLNAFGQINAIGVGAIVVPPL